MQLQFIFGPLVAVAGALAVLAWRVRESRRPVSTRAIVLPPLAMSTGFLMFALPATHVPWSWGLTALLLGALLFSYPMACMSRLERVGDVVMMQRSRGVLAVLVAMAALRFTLRDHVDDIISPLQTGALFYLLAFGMIACWRAWMLFEYRRLRGDAALAVRAVAPAVQHGS
jgi:membrane protein CcdC involved in cytochrome C biogenesis